MGHDALKLELIEWLTNLKDNETIDFLKVVKDSKQSGNDWWDDLSQVQKTGIERCMKDKRQEKTMAFEDVKKKYGL